MKKKPKEHSAVKNASLPRNPKLRAIAEAFALDVPQLMSESEEEILEAWNAASEEAQANDKAALFQLTFGVRLDLGADKMTSKLSYGVRRTSEISRQIPDPNQTVLPLRQEGGAA